jgi:hypothetical protein
MAAKVLLVFVFLTLQLTADAITTQQRSTRASLNNHRSCKTIAPTSQHSNSSGASSNKHTNNHLHASRK